MPSSQPCGIQSGTAAEIGNRLSRADVKTGNNPIHRLIDESDVSGRDIQLFVQMELEHLL